MVGCEWDAARGCRGIPILSAASGDGGAAGDSLPWALVHVFGVEMWERFSFYRRRAAEVPYFSILGGIAILLGIGLLLSIKPVLKLMKDVR